MTLRAGALLDACVLIPMPLADTLLRMAESPSLYRPFWTSEIMLEVHRNLVAKFGLEEEDVARREAALREHFPDAWVEGYESRIAALRNHPKDRHVLAAAIHAGADSVVTLNERDFPNAVLNPFGLRRQGPSNFLLEMFEREPETVLLKLRAQAAAVNFSMDDLLERLKLNVPEFVAHLRRID